MPYIERTKWALEISWWPYLIKSVLVKVPVIHHIKKGALASSPA